MSVGRSRAFINKIHQGRGGENQRDPSKEKVEFKGVMCPSEDDRGAVAVNEQDVVFTNAGVLENS